jgi:pimeloyl-ACP methyl ester carboxylesterase
MTHAATTTIRARTGERLAFAARSGRTPTLVFLPGYMSDMQGSKAQALDAWCGREGHACLRLDYSGCGASEGRFRDGTLTRWRDDVIDVIAGAVPDGPLVLVGSSMGGWLMLLVALAMPARVAGLVGIAAAPDFTDWGFDAAQKALLATGEDLVVPSAYADEPYVTTADFWASGQANLLLGGCIGLDCPVRLLHGQADPDVPWQVSTRLAAALGSADVQTLLVKDGDHRLSRPEDIARLVRTVGTLLQDLDPA